MDSDRHVTNSTPSVQILTSSVGADVGAFVVGAIDGDDVTQSRRRDVMSVALSGSSSNATRAQVADGAPVEAVQLQLSFTR